MHQSVQKRPRDMKVGTSSMVFWNRPVQEAITRIGDSGLDTVEIWPEHLLRFGGRLGTRGVRKALTRRSLVSTVHCPVMDINITSPNPGIRRESQRQVIRGIQFAADIGAQVFVLHPGRLFSAKESVDEHWARQVEALEPLLEEADRRQVLIGLENMEFFNVLQTVKGPEHVRYVLDQFPDKVLGVTLDMAHLADTQRCVQFIHTLGDRIVHLHVSDALADGDPHHPLGAGVLDLPTVLGELLDQGYKGCLSLEVFLPGDMIRLQGEADKVRRSLS